MTTFSARSRWFVGAAFAFTVASLNAAVSVPTETTGIQLPKLGTIKPRAASEIASSPWSIGGETLDRDYADYSKYKSYLGPLGAKGLRLQAGWAKCEKVKGVYDFAWLDVVIDDAISQGVRPWLELSYGNTLYEGGGDTGLGGGFPSSVEGLAAWDRWARALVERYKERVLEWEIWNEPDLNNKGTATVEAYVDLYIRTANILREVQPKAKLWALALAHTPAYADKFIVGMHAKGKLDLIDAITIHGYPRNPDDTQLVDQVRASIAKFDRPIQVRQGETGAPSRIQENFALRNISFTETTHAKWDLRRLLAHRAKDVPMNLFTLSDLHYTQPNHQGGPENQLRMNYKGLLWTNPDKSVAGPKAAYPAVQVVFSVFDDSLGRIKEFPFTSSALRGVAVGGYERGAKGAQVVAYWFNDAPPADGNGVSLADLTLPAGRFTEPVLVDVRTNQVYAISRDSWTQSATGAVFRQLPIYDSPMLIVEKSLLTLN